MSLPPGFLDEIRNRTSLAQVVGRRVVWDARKSNQGKGDMWAPCPFHQEATPSFHVDDRKGYYYCFGCQAKGDVFTFVKETENVDFMEAVKILAAEAGMQMPARDPAAQAKADRGALLVEVCEAALKWFRLQLKTAAAAEARAYLSRRGLDPEACARWELGFAPPGWQGLWEHLRGAGTAAELILEAGLARPSDRGRDPYDTFRNRIVFPIRDGRGRAIAFGGRAMDPGDNAKYLNSPETPLFDKGRNLYNHAPARAAAGRGAPLIVAEGYMDVIALGEAGFGAAVAPLGTAITEAQLQLLWRIDPEPVIALDGDKAGLRAAERLMDLALPHLAPERTLRFALMPEGQDPDDLIRNGGAAAMQAALDRAAPLVDLLWRRETEGRLLDSPERRAAVDAALRAAVRRIADPSVRNHYGAEIAARRRALFQPQGADGSAPRAGARLGRGWTPPAAPRAATRASPLAAGAGATEGHLREAAILALLVRHPALIGEAEDRLERLDMADAGHARLLSALLDLAGAAPDVVATGLAERAGAETLEKLLSQPHLGVLPVLRADDPALAAQCLTEEIDKLLAERGLAREVAEAVADLTDRGDERVTWRLSEAAAANARAGRPDRQSGSEFDVAPNGVRLDRAERAALDGLLAEIGRTDGRKRGP
ncbi:DNA primase [Rhodobacteraceae bacterium CCMM004]|nr:DNA primase [Rhodobacteraceae bacterium CCMM004]